MAMHNSDVILTDDVRFKIKSLIEQTETSFKNLEEVTGISASTLCRLSRGKTSIVRDSTLRLLELYFDTDLHGSADKSTENLMEMLTKLEEENRMLKKLLSEKWEQEMTVKNT